MNEERRQILDMLASGTISAADAEQLIHALGSAEPDERKPKIDPAPDMGRFRRYWDYPFIAGLALMGMAGLCASNTSLWLLGLCAWTVVGAGAILAIIGWFSQWSPWAHIHIREQDGTRINISVPLPIGFIGSLVTVARPVVRWVTDDRTTENLETAASFLMMADGLNFDDPIEIEVNEDDGDFVQVCIG